VTDVGTPLAVGFGGRTLFEYWPDAAPRPHIGALYSANGIRITRDITTAPAESDDHPHHKGVWWGHRDVNGADVWTEFAGHGRIVPAGPAERSVHGDAVTVTHATRWVDAHGDPLLDDTRVLRATAPRSDGSHTLDIESTIRAAYGRVVLGDTKEAGLVAVRVAPALEERRGGRIVLSSGEVGEAASWGVRSGWCDYSGTIDGIPLGIAIFDHPGNPRAAHWHVRDYGLMAANPFGLSDFSGDTSVSGALSLEAGTSLRFRYRLQVHPGDAHTGWVDGHYARYLDEQGD
jgi:hypothetical protein